MQLGARRKILYLELALVFVAIGLAIVAYTMAAQSMVVLNLFYLPVVLSGFYLGRYRTGILAVFCVTVTSTVVMLQMHDMAGPASPLVIGLAVTIWSATLGLTALIVGTLSDEHARQATELHEAYVGVVEVLSKYLQGGNSQLQARSVRVAEQSQRVALEMNLTSRQIDDVRVAALMQDLGDIEVTTKVISKAVDSLQARVGSTEHYSFQGTDLVQSLGTVLRGALPLVLNQDANGAGSPYPWDLADNIPIGARIISRVRTFDTLTTSNIAGPGLDPQEALRQIRQDPTAAADAAILNALDRVVVEYEPALL